MKNSNHFTAFIRLSLVIVLLVSPCLAQQRRTGPGAPKRPATPAVAEPAPTFDSILAADNYRIYSEVRNIGSLVRSPAFNELLEPVIKLGGPPEEFRTVLKWINAHADALASSRVFAASWSANPKLPSVLVGIEFDSADEAKKFELELRGFAATVLATPTPSPMGSSSAPSVRSNAAVPRVRNSSALPFQIKQAGSLLLLSEKAVSFSDLKPRGSRLLSEDPNFALARNRFASEPIFVYVDFKAIEKEREEQAKKYEEEWQRMEAAAAKNPPHEVATEEFSAQTTLQVPSEPAADITTVATQSPSPETSPALPPPADQVETNATLSSSTVNGPSDNEFSGLPFVSLYSAFFGGRSKWPDALGIAIAFEGDTYVARALIISSENKANPIPFLPQFVSGPELVPESPSVLPSDIDMFVTASLDYPQIYEGMVKAISSPDNRSIGFSGQTIRSAERAQPESPFAAYEKKLGLKIKDDLLPLLGNEVGLGLSWKPAKPKLQPEEASSTGEEPKEKELSIADQTPIPVLAIAVKDRDAVRSLLPRIVESLAFKGANLLAQTEKRDDTEITTYANAVSYALVGNFLILSTDPVATRHAVDSYLKQNTLASTSAFKNFTRWQPRQVLAQVYVSPQIMEAYNPIMGSRRSGSQKLAEYVSQINPLIEPTTYALSIDGQGLLHELRIPKNLLRVMIGGTVAGVEESSVMSNEALAKNVLQIVLTAEATYQSTVGYGSYGSIEQLVEAKLVPKDLIAGRGYRFEVIASKDKFEATAVPTDYGVSGRMSYFIDESGIIRGGDHGGAPATLSDSPVR